MTQARPIRRVPVLAAGLSVVPGLGQMYAGYFQRGLVLLIGLPAQAAVFYGAGLIWLAWCLGLVWAWNLWDAYSLAGGRRISASLPAVMILVMNLVPAWTLTEIRVPELNAPKRKQTALMLQQLLTPDMAVRRPAASATASFIVPGPGAPGRIEEAIPVEGEASVSIEPANVQKGGKAEVSGAGFNPGRAGRIYLVEAVDIQIGAFRAGPDGSFRATLTNPTGAPGVHQIIARSIAPQGAWQFSETLTDAAPRMLQTVYLALVGTALSLVFALPLSFFGARNLMSGSAPLKIIYGLTRGLFTVLRSVEVLIFAVIAVVAVGVGPFAGVIALAIHGIGAIGKLYSEAIESIEPGPIEAIRATGANELQVVVFGVVPQVVPQFIAFTLYRWDINVRMATVIGLVGGGGIGSQLMQYMGLLQWRQAATAIWLIAGVVMLMDYASAVIREKIG